MKIVTLLLFVLFASVSYAQPITTAQEKEIKKIELAIKDDSRKMIMQEEAIDRYISDSIFTKGLVRALRVTNSFYYPFDSITTVSKLYSPDSVFRIFTWQLVKDQASIRQKGAIQMRTADGSLKLIPLFDNSDESKRPVDSIRNNQRWIGAIYYKIILKTFNNKNYYTLLGYDENDDATNKKWIEVLTFDDKGAPQFGGHYFQYPNDELKPPQPAFRFCLEYKRDGRARMNYDPELDVIVFDHLISEGKTPNAAKRETLIPDGDYEAFKWTDGRWVHINKLFDYKADMQGVDPMKGNPPVPVPINENKEKTNKKGQPVSKSPYEVDDKKKPSKEERKSENY